MQAQDTASSLQASLVSAQATGDPAQVAAAQRAIDENNLSIQATAQRTEADKNYAAAVAQYQQERTHQEQEMNNALKSLGIGIQNGTQTINGPGGLSDVLGKFGLTASAVGE